MSRLAAWALRVILRWSGRRAGIVLVYHALADEPGDASRELVPAHGAEQFDAQLRHVARWYRIVRLEDLPSAVAARRRGRRFPVAITFDDDLVSHVEIAAVTLERHGAHATFFLCGASLEAPHAFWWELLQRAVDEGRAVPVQGDEIHELASRIESMTAAERDAVAARLAATGASAPLEPGLRAEQVRALADRGFGIGFHTLRHHRLTALDDVALSGALEEGRRELELAAGRPLTAIAYPHGRADERVARAAEAAGFRLGVTGRYEAVRSGSDPMLLGRIEPTHGPSDRFAAQAARVLARRRHA